MGQVVGRFPAFLPEADLEQFPGKDRCQQGGAPGAECVIPRRDGQGRHDHDANQHEADCCADGEEDGVLGAGHGACGCFTHFKLLSLVVAGEVLEVKHGLFVLKVAKGRMADQPGNYPRKDEDGKSSPAFARSDQRG